MRRCTILVHPWNCISRGGVCACNLFVPYGVLTNAQSKTVNTMSKLSPKIKPSEITPESVFLKRRSLLKAAVVSGLLPTVWQAADAAMIPPSGIAFHIMRRPGGDQIDGAADGVTAVQ